MSADLEPLAEVMHCTSTLLPSFLLNNDPTSRFCALLPLCCRKGIVGRIARIVRSGPSLVW